MKSQIRNLVLVSFTSLVLLHTASIQVQAEKIVSPKTLKLEDRPIDRKPKSKNLSQVIEGILKTFHEEKTKNIMEEKVNILFEKYIPKNIFVSTDGEFRDMEEDKLSYYRKLDDSGTALIKMEALFNKKGQLIQYHLKNYSFQIEASTTINQEEALELANDFIKNLVDESVVLEKVPNLYSSLYEEGIHETYGDQNKKYILVVDLESGYVEFFKTGQ